MIKFIRFSILIFILLFAISAYPAEHKFRCAPAKEIMLLTLQQGFAYLATAEEANGIVVQLYIELNNGDWRVIGIDNDMKSCILLNGHNWQFLVVSQQM